MSQLLPYARQINFLNIQNMVDERQMPFPNTNFPVSPVGSQMAGKPGFAQSIGIRGTVSPNVTIGMPKKPQYRPQEEGWYWTVLSYTL